MRLQAVLPGFLLLSLAVGMPAHADWQVLSYGSGSAGSEVGAASEALEFASGLNVVTVDGVHRWQLDHFTPYVGAGLSVTPEAVEQPATAFRADTLEPRAASIGTSMFAGIDIPIAENFWVFGQYKFSYEPQTSDGQAGDERSFAPVDHQVNLGLTYKFGD